MITIKSSYTHLLNLDWFIYFNQGFLRFTFFYYSSIFLSYDYFTSWFALVDNHYNHIFTLALFLSYFELDVVINFWEGLYTSITKQSFTLKKWIINFWIITYNHALSPVMVANLCCNPLLIIWLFTNWPC